jgi:hypothetical protein
MTLEEEQAAETRAAEDARRLGICDQIEALIVEVREKHPTVPLHSLAPYLQEPARGRLVELLEQCREWIPMPRDEESDG